ncbi:hypothetical protein D5041_06015 [Verminephrobacter aporrectodeae subsp. tuberculatae]|uniref:hypothetical protein n=1 Tax=Verminephrobacter aporrectodeae TaxID=1110389 RepID=UPI0022381F70|nr:hypothetical protein [Verminephrobacter aporrectodeae]MCW5223165.1 hypothetical protein [Verminephrobacter aporrectodeae subsp. tuberculatae]MCW5288629.1 hypothetical protein [Verminephrobacter aporrectodeae subsp. tuberculatae]
MFDPGETTSKDGHTASENDSATLAGDYTALQENYTALTENYTALKENYTALQEGCTALKEFHTTLRDDYIVLMNDYLALMIDYLAFKNGDTPVADGGNGDGANSLEHAPADLPKGMEMPVELSKKALASATRTEHSCPSVDLAQGITDYWVEDETAPRVNPASSPVCKVVMEDGQCGPITDGGKYAAGGEFVIVGQALDAQTPGF